MQATRKLATVVHCHAYMACPDPGCLADLISQGLAHDPKGGLKKATTGQLGRTHALNHGASPYCAVIWQIGDWNRAQVTKYLGAVLTTLYYSAVVIM